MAETMSAEARALHAVLDEDDEDAERILSAFLPGELRALRRACGRLGAICEDYLSVRAGGDSEAP